MRVTLQTLCQIQLTSSRLRYVNCGPDNIRCNYSSTYSGLNIQLNVAVLLLEIFRHLNVRYTASMVPNTAQVLQFMPSELWSRSYTMYLQLHIFRIQYSAERISAAIGDMSTIEGAIYCKLGFSANTAYKLQFTQCELWSRAYTMYLQLLKFELPYSTERMCAAIGDILTIQCALYSKRGAKYSAHPPIYAI
jgi:hypothetical protein